MKAELAKRVPGATGKESVKHTDEKPEGNTEPKSWSEVRETDLCIIEEIAGNTLLEAVDAQEEWKASF